MIKDYTENNYSPNTENKKNSRNSASIGKHYERYFWFFGGLAISACIALIVYWQNPQEQPIHTPTSILSSQETKCPPTEETEKKLEYDFYKILPNRNMNVSEWITDSEPQIQSPTVVQVETNPTTQDDELIAQTKKSDDIKPRIISLILQAGSFKQYPAAKQLQTKLAEIGITAHIQRVVLNGDDDVLHRVRIGPYHQNETERIRDIKRRLYENQIDFTLLKLKSSSSP